MRIYLPGQRATRQQDLENRQTEEPITYVTRVDFTAKKVKRQTRRVEAGKVIVSRESDWEDG